MTSWQLMKTFSKNGDLLIKYNFKNTLFLLTLLGLVTVYNNCSSGTSKVSTYKPPSELTCTQGLYQKTQGSTGLSLSSLLEQRSLNLFQVPNTGNWEDVSSDNLRLEQTYLDHLDAEEAHQIVYDQIPSNMEPVVVAVIDTGVDHNHPDLTNQMYKNGSGQIIGYDFADNEANAMDIGGHGTHVSGLIAAEGHNSEGIRGGAPEYVKIMPIRVIGPDGGSVANIRKGIEFAIDNGADIINMSLGATGPNNSDWREVFNLEDLLQEAIDQGIIVTIASGNEGVELNYRIMTYPAVFGSEMSGVITVGAYNVADVFSLSPFSNFSSRHVELQAPGSVGLREGLISTCPSGFSDPIYCKIAGTSMATPLVAGLIALIKIYLKKKGAQLNAYEIEQLIKESSNKYQSLIQLGQDGRAINYKSTIDRLVQIYESDILEHPKYLRLAPGQNGRLAIKVDPYAPDLTFQWYHNGQPIEGADEIELLLRNVSSENEGNYHVEVNRVSGDTVSSLAAEVQVITMCHK